MRKVLSNAKVLFAAAFLVLSSSGQAQGDAGARHLSVVGNRAPVAISGHCIVSNKSTSRVTYGSTLAIVPSILSVPELHFVGTVSPAISVANREQSAYTASPRGPPAS